MTRANKDDSEENNADVDSERSSINDTRRRFLAGLGAVGVAGIAGCGGGDEPDTPAGDGGDGGDGSDGGDGGDGGDGDTETDTPADDETEEPESKWADDVAEPVVDAEWSITSFQTAGDPVFNMWNNQGSGDLGEVPNHGLLADFNDITREFIPVLAEGWEYNQDEGYLDVTLMEGLTWHNGEDVTSEDIVVRWELEQYVTASIDELEENGEVVSNSGVWNFVDDVSAEDDRTVRFNVPEPVNSDILLNVAVWDEINVPRFIFGEWVDRFEDATDDAESFNEVRSEFQSWKQPDPVGTSPWQVTQMSDQRVDMERYEDHPFAENINFSDQVQYAAPNNQDHWALFNSEKTNTLGAAAPESVEENFPESAIYYENLIPNYFGSAMDFNLDHEIVGKRKVRQAIAYAVDARNPADANGYIPVTDNFTGIGGGPAGVPGQVLGDVRSNYVDYDITEGTGSEDWERAEQLLEEAGLSKEDGTWMRPDGDPFELPIKVVAAHSDMVKQYQVVAGQLQEFGIDATMETVEGATFWDMMDRGDWVAIEGFWVNAFPYNQFDAWYNFTGDTREGFGWTPVIEDVPKPFDADSEETVDIDMRSLVQELGQEADEERQQELLQQLAWGFNHELPTLPIEERMVGPTWNAEAQGRKFIVPDLNRPDGARGDPIDGEDRAAFAQQVAEGQLIERGIIAAAAEDN